jgi:hypothetical protein
MGKSLQRPVTSRAERIAFNEAWSRDLNSLKARWLESDHPVTGFRCECSRPDCDQQILLSGRDWREVRRRGNRFAVAPGHVASDVEAVIDERFHFWLIEKLGEAGKLAEDLE